MLSSIFKSKKVLITGGMGFIGSNLAKHLVEDGANVTLLDSMLPDYGGNPLNIHGFENLLKVSYTDLRDQYSLPHVIKGVDFIFNLAGQISHIESMNDPIADLEINAKSQINLLEVCRKINPSAVIVYASTRQIYGKTTAERPTNENHRFCPTDINGINKLCGELYHSLYHKVYNLKTISLRLTNTYGPRQLIKHNQQGFIGWFMNRTILSEKILLYGDGEQIRDFTYVEDVVSAILKTAINENCYGKVYNLGALRSYSLKEVSNILQTINPKLRIEHIPFPDERKKIDIGSYVADWSKIEGEVGWRPTVPLEIGLQYMYDYYADKVSSYIY